MKLVLKCISILFITSNSFGSQIGPISNDTIYYFANDSDAIGIRFYRENKIKEIFTFYGTQTNIIKNGYSYLFYENGKLENIRLYRNGEISGFLIHVNSNRTIDSLITPGPFNVLLSIENNVAKNFDKKGELTYLSGYIETNFIFKYDIVTGDLYRIYEATKDFNGFRDGIDIQFVENKIATIENYKNDINYGESLFFKRNEKLKYFMFTNNSKIGQGIKVKDIYKYLNGFL